MPDKEHYPLSGLRTRFSACENLVLRVIHIPLVKAEDRIFGEIYLFEQKMIVLGGLRVTDETGLVIFRPDDGMGFDTTLILPIIRILPYAFQDVPEQRYRG